MSAPLVIGIDFDNTIVDYGALFLRLAAEAGLFDPPFRGSRLELRAALRAREGGEESWQKLQAAAYGPRIDEATLSPGVIDFIDRALATGATVHIVSHKTEFAAAAPEGPSLRQAALGFMATHGILDDARLESSSVSFADTRAAKLRRIAELGCTHFVDDLEEVLGDDDFPQATTGILFAPGDAANWQQVWTRIFE